MPKTKATDTSEGRSADGAFQAAGRGSEPASAAAVGCRDFVGTGFRLISSYAGGIAVHTELGDRKSLLPTAEKVQPMRGRPWTLTGKAHVRVEVVRATVVQVRAQGGYQAETENEIAVAFSVLDGDQLALGDAIEVDPPNVLMRKTVVRSRDRKQLRIELRDSDLHDMRLPVQHGGSRTPTPARLMEGC